ncbi:MAG TPA: NAD(P)H-dependent glycerol-3-phosphate dehydrogenase [Gemmatimonadales bacterium]|nr:NAD(P)H-dependent glycerol-3-phosphate dehydrogenase [Gemmatimonadales bacterium]
MTTVAVLGAGNWGTALADLLARKGHTVRLWAFEPEVVDSINARHQNPLYLAGHPLTPALTATGDAPAAVRGAAIVVIAVPSHVFRPVLTGLAPAVAPGALVVIATKGLEAGTMALLSSVAGEVLPRARIVALSGPSFAEEVYARQPTAVVAASADAGAARETQDAFSTREFRVYAHHDVVGVQLGGALKNVIAIAAGILEGLGLGHNTRAALITRGLAEIARLGQAMGADPLTFAGLAGMGDLVLTTTGSLSRNRSLGLAVAEGKTLDEWRAGHRTVAEGAETSRVAVALAARHGVDLPICAQVQRILYEGQDARKAVAELMDRSLKAEGWQ